MKVDKGIVCVVEGILVCLEGLELKEMRFERK